MIVRGTIQNTALQKYLLLRLSRPASSFRIQLSDTVLTHIIKPASGLDCFLLRVGIVLLYCVSFTMYYKDLYLQTTPFMQAQYYYIYYGISFRSGARDHPITINFKIEFLHCFLTCF